MSAFQIAMSDATAAESSLSAGVSSLEAFSARGLAGLLLFSIATLWVPERWTWSLFQTGVFALAAAWLGARTDLAWSPMLVPLAGVTLWGTIQAAFGVTVYKWASWLAVLDWMTYLATAFVSVQVFAEPALRHRFLKAVACFGLMLSVVSSIQMFTSQGRVYWLFVSGYTDFVLGPFLYRNQYAAFMELLLPVVLWQALRDRRRAWLYWATASVMLASVIAGASRAGSVLIASEILIFLTIAAARRSISVREALFGIVKLSLLVPLCTLVLGWQVLWKRLQEPDPFAGRREILTSSFEMVRARPWWGFGLGTWPTAYPRYAHFDDGTFVNQAHNDWIQWAAEGGIPVALFLAFFASIAFGPAIRSLWGLGVVWVSAHACVDYPLQQRPAVAAWFFVFAVMAVEADRRRGRDPAVKLR
jgi:O-antigen ligase